MGHDELLQAALLQLLQLPEPLDAQRRHLSTFPRRYSGLGLRSSARTAPAALFGGWAAALPVLRQRFPGWAARFCVELDAPLTVAPCFVAARAAAALLAQEGFEVPPWRQLVNGLEPDRDAAPDLELGEWSHSWQFFAADAREQFAADQFFARLPPHGRALFLGQQGRHAGDFFLSLIHI